MKAIAGDVMRLVNCYHYSCSMDGRASVVKLAKQVLSSRSFSIFLDECISIEVVDVMLCEYQLGLSGVQNEDNL